MSTYEELKALKQLLNTLAIEPDDEKLLTRLRDGKPPAALEHANIPVEVLSASSIYQIAYYAQSLSDRLYGRMGVPRGEPVVRQKALDESVE